MENLKWKLSKSLKTAMRQKDIDTFTLAKIAEETYAKAHADNDLDVRQEVFKVIDEYASEVNLEILDLVCKILDVGVKFGESGDFKFAATLNLLQNLNQVQKPKTLKFTVKSKPK